MPDKIEYQLGIPEILRNKAAILYDEAFGKKLSVAVSNQERRLALIADSLLLPFSIAAMVDDELVGLAGFQTREGSLTKGMTLGKMFQHLGFLGGIRALIVFSLYERKPFESELLMDGIAVSQKMRGMGVGTKLLSELKQYAKEHKYTSIRLDVIDINTSARRLYEREGFVATKTEEFKFLRWLLGFGASTTMTFEIGQEA